MLLFFYYKNLYIYVKYNVSNIKKKKKKGIFYFCLYLIFESIYKIM